MNIKLFNSRLLNILQQRNMLLAIAFSLLLLNFVQASYLFMKVDRILVVPADVRKEFWVEQNRVSSSYLEEMAIVFADLILENTPSGAAYRRDIVLRNSTGSGVRGSQSQASGRGEAVEEAEPLHQLFRPIPSKSTRKT